MLDADGSIRRNEEINLLVILRPNETRFVKVGLVKSHLLQPSEGLIQKLGLS